MKPEVPRMRRFFFLPAEEQLYLQMYLPAAGVCVLLQAKTGILYV